MKKTLILLMIIMFGKAMFSQNQVWVKQIGGNAYCKIQSTCVTPNGNLYVSGYFKGGTLYLSPIDSITHSGLGNYFIAKYNNLGGLIWYKHINGPSTSSLYYFEISICCDNNGNPYIAGHFEGSLTIENTCIYSQGLSDVFIASLTSTGALNWLHRVGGGGDDYAADITVDYDGNIVIIGHYCYTANFGGTSLTSNGEWDVFVLKMNTSGNNVWLKSFYSSGNEQATLVKSDNNGSLIISGVYGWSCQMNSSSEFHLDSLTIYASSYSASGTPDQQESFLAKISSIDGSPIWAKSVNGNYMQKVTDVAINSQGKIDLCGWFESKLELDGSNVTSSGQSDIFWAQIDANASLINLQSGGSPNYDGNAVLAAVSPGENLLLANFTGSANFFNNNYLSSSGNMLALVLSDQQSLLTYWQSYGNIVSANADINNGVFLAANFTGNISVGNQNLNSGGQQNSYIVYYSNINSINDVKNINADFKAYFNPENKSINVECGEEYSEIQATLIDISGKEIKSQYFHKVANFEVDATSLSKGIYIMNVITNKYNTSSKILIY